MRQLSTPTQRIQIRQLADIIRGQYQRRQTRQGRRDIRLDMFDAVASEEEGLQTGEEGEVA